MRFLPVRDKVFEFQMVSFVDVIFVLLAFFVLGTQFRLDEKDFALGMQQAALPSGARSEDFPKSVLVELKPAAGGKVRIQVAQADLGVDNFQGLRQKLAEINMPQMDVIVRADDALSVDQLSAAMEAVLNSPMKRVSLATPAESAELASATGDGHGQ